tara:strand:- start:63 stop:353 length:291 start_codon:yes stop_codon:yes gene_type:complete
MKKENLIPADEICIRYKVEHQFVTSLNESGIIKIVRIEETEYVDCNELGQLEKMMRLHQDLDINLEGLEAIHHLLNKLNQLQKDNRRLKNRLGLYE